MQGQLFWQCSKAVVVVAAALLLSACSAGGSRLMSDNQAHRQCPVQMTYSCVEYMGRKVRCVCSGRDSLEAILEPDLY